MEKEELLQKYGGRKIKMDEVSSYEQWSLDFFHQKEIVREPNLQMTLQVDITEGYQYYQENLKQYEGASFTAYLMWTLVETMKKHPYFRYRKIEDEWYVFDNLPVFSPIAVGGETRFTEIIVEDPAQSTIETYFKNYKKCLDYAFNRDGDFAPLPVMVWATAHFIGNLPNLQFTSFQLHASALDSARPYFYFGKRYQQGDQLLIPLSITFDHSSLDPFVLSAFMADFEAQLKQ
ncbi:MULTISPECIES: CatA-like O-acetyltransferase [unclassified Flammeovirga]|uniref:CatA-like O-acetyltransferase n=1 Tax=unclassified Flammeovirga TaxID=2637820 RepID=UPI0005C5E98D|nr:MULTISPECIES: CatA-like O-acetyltransferase [unclassified Flammeovirga]MBD0404502.1 hypothetical protein [Flammeovirga sp. EKP202]